MARIEFKIGIKCNKCGKVLPISKIPFSLLCQTCGADLKSIYYGEVVTVKVTHKLFRTIYEEANNES